MSLIFSALYAKYPCCVVLYIQHVRTQDNIKNFFNDVYELYLKILMNPFYEPSTPIKSKLFDQKVRAVARKYGLS